MNRSLLCAAAACVAAAAPAFAQVYTISDGNSSAHFDTSTAGGRVGMDNWTVDGVNHMYNHWFWFRTDGMTNEARLNSLALGVNGTTDTDFDGNHDTLFLSYGGNGFTITTRFVIQGGAAGSNTSDIAEQITITNTGTSPRTFSFFQYTDFDLNNDTLDDTVGLANANSVFQHDLLSGTTVSETVFAPTFSLSEMNIFPTTQGALDDGDVDNLDGSAGPLVGRRDYTWALQWNFTLGAGESFIISKDLLITPTPGSMALLGLGGLAVSRRRRR